MVSDLPTLTDQVKLNGMNKFQEVLVAFYEDWRRGRQNEKNPENERSRHVKPPRAVDQAAILMLVFS